MDIHQLTLSGTWMQQVLHSPPSKLRISFFRDLIPHEIPSRVIDKSVGFTLGYSVCDTIWLQPVRSRRRHFRFAVFVAGDRNLVIGFDGRRFHHLIQLLRDNIAQLFSKPISCSLRFEIWVVCIVVWDGFVNSEGRRSDVGKSTKLILPIARVGMGTAGWEVACSVGKVRAAMTRRWFDTVPASVPPCWRRSLSQPIRTIFRNGNKKCSYVANQ